MADNEKNFRRRVSGKNCICPGKNGGRQGIDAIIAHSHEADFANVRYFSNYWPLFETGGIFIPQEGDPTLIIGPESETFAAGRSKIQNIAKILEYRESAEPAYPGIELDLSKALPKNPAVLPSLIKSEYVVFPSFRFRSIKRSSKPFRMPRFLVQSLFPS